MTDDATQDSGTPRKRPKYHLTYLEGGGYGLMIASSILYFVPRAWVALLGLGGLLVTVSSHLNNTPIIKARAPENAE